MKRHFVCLFYFFLFIGVKTSFAQLKYFNKLYNNNGWFNYSNGILNLNGHYLTAGNTVDLLANDSTNERALWLFYLDSSGNKGFEKTIRIKDHSVTTINNQTIRLTLDSQFLFIGQISDTTGSWSIIIKLDSILNPIWQHIDSGKGYSFPTDVVLLSDSGFMLCGISSQSHQTQMDGFISRFDKSGNRLWTKYYGDSREDNLRCGIEETDTSTLFVRVIDKSIFLMKVDAAGNIIWQKFINSPNTGLSLKKSSYGGFIAFGSRNNGLVNDYHGVVGRMNENAEFIWKDSIQHGTWVNTFYDVLELPGGNIIAMGVAHNTNNTISSTLVGWLAKFHKDGGIIREKVFLKADGTPSDLNDIEFTSDNGIICIGMTVNDYDPLPYGQDSWVVKLDTNLCDTPNCSPDVGIKGFTTDNELTFYPNPFTNEILIQYTNTSLSNVSIRIYNAQGILIKETLLEKSKQNIVFPTNSYAPGIYIIQLLRNGAIAKTHKLVKQL